MSVHAIYSDSDKRRIKQAKKRRRSVDDLKPRPIPLAFVVRWRQHPGGGDTSCRFRVADFESVREAADAAHELDRDIRVHKRDNRGFALRHQILNDTESEGGLMLLAEYLRGAFMDYVLADLSPNSQFTYARKIETLILNMPMKVATERNREPRRYEPTPLGITPLDQITPSMCVSWRQELLRRGVGRRSVAIAYEVLRSAFSHAVETLGFLGSSPMHRPTARGRKHAKRGRAPIKPNRVVAPDLVEAIRLRYLHRGRPRTALGVSLLAYLGFRISELMPRVWGDLVDATGNAHHWIALETTVSDGQVVDRLKGGHPLRMVKVFEPIRQEIEETYRVLGCPPLDELVITRDDGKPGILDPDDFSDRLRRVRKLFGSRFRPQDLRHTCASILGSGGDEERGTPWTFTEIGDQLGHSPDISARIYQHVVKDPKYRGKPIETVILTARSEAPAAHEARKQKARGLYADSVKTGATRPEHDEAEDPLIREFSYAPRRRWRPDPSVPGRFDVRHLVDLGLLSAGEPLTGRTLNGEVTALIADDCRIEITDGRSFQTVTGASTALMGKTRNGWPFWRVERDGVSVRLAELRKQAEAVATPRPAEGATLRTAHPRPPRRAV